MKDSLTTLAIQEIKPVTNADGKTVDNNLQTNVITIINAVIGVLGVVCVVVMIIGGVQYMTSTGDASKVEKGKKTILYGLIGLIICALSFAIVNFTINDIMKGGSTTQTQDQGQTKK